MFSKGLGPNSITNMNRNRTKEKTDETVLILLPNTWLSNKLYTWIKLCTKRSLNAALTKNMWRLKVGFSEGNTATKTNEISDNNIVTINRVLIKLLSDILNCIFKNIK